MKIYVIGSMRNKQIPVVANRLRAEGFDAFDEWFAPGEQADEKWKEYEQLRGREFIEALQGYHAKHVFEFDKFHLDTCDVAVLVLPAGRSGHIELGYVRGCKKPCYILLEEQTDRFDVMYGFATKVFATTEDLIAELRILNFIRPKFRLYDYIQNLYRF